MKKKWVTLLLALTLVVSFVVSASAVGGTVSSKEGNAPGVDICEGESVTTALANGLCPSCNRTYSNIYTYTVYEAAGSGGNTCPNVVAKKGASIVAAEEADPPKADYFEVIEHWSYERCSYCNYQSAHWISFKSYAAFCNNGDFPVKDFISPYRDGAWEVKLEYRPSTSRNLHQSLRWWLYHDNT